MRSVLRSVVCTAALLALTGAARAALVNPGFELDNASAGDVAGATGWGSFNSTFTTASFAHSGTQSLKVFGPFFNGGGAGVTQNVPATPGTNFTASVFALNASSDPIQGTNFGTLDLNFLDAGNNTLATFESPHITSATPQDVWTSLSAAGTAPAGTVAAQIVLVHVQLNNPVTGGSVFWDDASLAPSPVPEPATAALALGALGGLALRRRRGSLA